MPGRLSDLITRRASEDFVGRTAELAVLLQSLEGGGPLVVGVHGIGGVGKSTLLEAFSQRARARDTGVVRLDCRTIEPTERGFLAELGAAIGATLHDATGGADRLSALGERVVLALDAYELLRLLDTWLRQVFVPALGDNVRVVLCGREPLVSAWRTAPR
jgi:ABC-type cobalamin/Fe3+-siderophores transport system ATPase subunit